MSTIRKLKEYVEYLEKNNDLDTSIIFDTWSLNNIIDQAKNLGYSIDLEQAEEIIENIQYSINKYGYGSLDIDGEIMDYADNNDIELIE